MNQEEKTGFPDFLFILVILSTFFAFIIFGVGGYFEYNSYQDKKQECKDWNEYGYVTEFVDNWKSFSSFDNDYECLIYMNDGTKLPLDDFKTMAIKQPMLR